MLKQLRSRKTMQRVMKVTLVLVIPSFVLFYGWSALSDNQREAALSAGKVKGPTWKPWEGFDSVDRGELQAAGENLMRYKQIEYQIAGLAGFMPQGSPTDLFSANELLREAVNQRIVRRFAEKAGLRVTKEDLINAVAGQFGPGSTGKAQFNYYLQRMGLNEEMYLEQLRSQMLDMEAMAMFMPQASVSLFELWQEYTLQNEKLTLDYVRIDAEQFKDTVALDEEALKAFFEEHREDYRIPDQRKYRYISTSRAKIADEIEVGPDEARAFYDENIDTYPLFRTSPRTKVRQIFLKYPDLNAAAPDPEARAELRTKMQGILDQARAEGADFAALADQYSDAPPRAAAAADSTTPTKTVGGMVGWIGEDADRAKWGARFVDAALELTEPNQISDIVEGLDGLHILQAVEFEPSKPKDFAEVARLAEDAARDTLIGETLKQEIEKLRQEKEKFSSLNGLAESIGWPTQETDFLDIDDYLIDPNVGSLARHDSYIKNLEIGYLSSVLETSVGAICLAVSEIKPTRLPELSEVREDAENDFREAKALEMAKAKAEAAVEQGRSAPDGLERWAEAENLEVKTTAPFARIENAPPDFSEQIDEFKNLTYKTPVGALEQSSLSLGGQKVGYLVWRIKAVDSPSSEEFAKDYFMYLQQSVSLKQFALYQEWLADERAKWKVKLPETETEG